jgi:hypothetical protein
MEWSLVTTIDRQSFTPVTQNCLFSFVRMLLSTIVSIAHLLCVCVFFFKYLIVSRPYRNGIQQTSSFGDEYWIVTCPRRTGFQEEEKIFFFG